MLKNTASSLWEVAKIAIALFTAWCVIEACGKRGLSQIEAVGCTVTAAIVWASFLMVKVMGVVGDHSTPSWTGLKRSFTRLLRTRNRAIDAAIFVSICVTDQRDGR